MTKIFQKREKFFFLRKKIPFLTLLSLSLFPSSLLHRDPGASGEMAGRRANLLRLVGMFSLLLELLLVITTAQQPARAAPHNVTASALEAEIARLTAAAAGFKQDAAAGKRGTTVHGEVLQKPAKVPKELWPDVGNNDFTWTNTDARNFALSNATIAYSNVVGIG